MDLAEECSHRADESRRIALNDCSLPESGYEQLDQLLRTVAELDRQKNDGTIARLLGEEGGAFDAADVTKLILAYHEVLHRLDLADRQDGVTLMIAKRIIGLAVEGERDPEQLTARTIEALAGGRDQP
jgi:hypothetical protein